MKTSACAIKCALCGADLSLAAIITYVNEGPICPSCLGQRSGQWNYSGAELWNALSVAMNRIRELEISIYTKAKARLSELEDEHKSLCEDHEALLAEYREHRDRADRAEAKLLELVKEIDKISNDYIPDNDTMAPLALDEMRGAIWDALEAAKEG